MPKVSVIIPAYNSMTFLPETIESVFAQTFTDFEIIVVNDGSSDSIEQWATKISDTRFKLVSQENQGCSAARNKGIELSNGELIAFLDADDLWEETKLEKQVKCLDENPEAGLVYTWVSLINTKSEPLGKVIDNNLDGSVWQELTKHNIVECGSVPLVRRSCFETVGNFDCNLSTFIEDWDMWLRIATRYPFRVVKQPLVYYRNHSNNASKNWHSKVQDYRHVIEKNFASVPSELEFLKKQSYASGYINLAWKNIQSHPINYKQAFCFRREALMYYPQWRFSKPYIKQTLAIFLLQIFKLDDYEQLRLLLYKPSKSNRTLLKNKNRKLNNFDDPS